jgi:GNAT superfamily N-acetyltransferase
MPKTHLFTTVLNSTHKRDAFNCSEPELDNYLKHYARQHAKNNISRTFIAAPQTDPTQVLGFYTLSAGSIIFDDLPIKLQKKLPKYPIPIARIGRLAVDTKVHGQGIGEYLLMDALYRCTALANEIGIVGVAVDAKNKKAKTFYLKYGFYELTNTPLKLFIPLQDVISATKI